MDVIISAGTVGVALTLGVPSQAHYLGDIDLGLRECRKSSLRNLFLQSLGLDMTNFVAAKQGCIKTSVFHALAVILGTTTPPSPPTGGGGGGT